MNGSECKQCGMLVEPATAYHPYAACLMFKACKDGNVVQANLDAVVAHGRQSGEPREQPPKNWAIWTCVEHDRMFTAWAGCSKCAEAPQPETPPSVSPALPERCPAVRASTDGAQCLLDRDHIGRHDYPAQPETKEGGL